MLKSARRNTSIFRSWLLEGLKRTYCISGTLIRRIRVNLHLRKMAKSRSLLTLKIYINILMALRELCSMSTRQGKMVKVGINIESLVLQKENIRREGCLGLQDKLTLMGIVKLGTGQNWNLSSLRLIRPKVLTTLISKKGQRC
jgi:hypothetical protein